MAEKIKYTVEIDDNGSGAKVDNLNSKLKDTGKTAEDSQGKMGKLGQSLSNIKGPVGQAVQAVQGFGKALLVLAANPIVLVITLLVASVTALFKAFTSTKEGGEKLSQAMAGISAVMDVLRDTLVKVGAVLMAIFKDPKQAILDFAEMLKTNITNRFEGLLELIPALGKAMKLLFEGEFSEAGKVATNAVAKVALGVEDVTGKLANMGDALKNVIDEAAKEAKIAANIEKRLQRIADAERNLGVERAKQNKELAKARLQMEDENATLAERIEALDKVAKSEESLAEKELKLARQKSQAIIERNALSDSSAEQLQEQADAQARVFELEAQSLLRQRKTSKAIESLNKEDAAKRKEAAKQREDEDKAKAEADKKFLEDALKGEEEFINKKYDLQKLQALREIEDAEKLAAELESIEQSRTKNIIQAREDAGKATTDLELKIAEELSKKKIDIAKKEADAKKALDKAKLDSEMELMAATSGALNSFAKLAGEQTAAGKVLALASTVIDTYAGATKALSVGAGTPAGYINAAAIIATGLANVRTITAVQVPNETGVSAPSMPSISGPSVGIIQGQMSQTSQLQAEMNAQMKRPTRAYVVGQNVTTQQSLDRHILENATL